MTHSAPKTELDAAHDRAKAAARELNPEHADQVRKHESVAAAVRNRIAGAEADVAKQKAGLISDLEIVQGHALLLRNLETQQKYLADFTAAFDEWYGGDALITAAQECGRLVAAPSALPDGLAKLAQVAAAQAYRAQILSGAREAGVAPAERALAEYVEKHGAVLGEYQIIS